MIGNFIRVYRSSLDGRRFMFLWYYNSRLKYEPLSLYGFVVVHPGTGESHSYVFTESYNCDVRKELQMFQNLYLKEETFRVNARLSLESFCKLLHSIGYNTDWDYGHFQLPFETA